MRQDETPAAELSVTEPAALPEKQEKALAYLLAGQGVTAAAQAAGVSRQPVHRWKSDDAGFVAAYNAARRELAETLKQERTLLACEAAQVTRRLLGDDGVPAAVR